MGVRRVISVLAAMAVSTVLVGAGTTQAQAAQAASAQRVAASAGETNPSGTVKALYSASGFQELLDHVTAQVRLSYPNAQLGLADGSAPTGPTTHVKDVTTWRLVYFGVTSDRHRVAITATVHLPSRTATITAERTAYISLGLQQPVTMSPFRAALLAHIAGYREAYDSVWLHQPQGYAPRYSFFSGNDAVTVDTATGAVTPGL